MLFWLLFIIFFIPIVILFPIRIVNKKNLKSLKGKNYIIACNHMSNYDAILIDFKMRKKYRILAKIELFTNWLKSGFLKSLGAIPIDRTKTDTKAIKQVFREINKKHDICIFPQGTRKPTPEIEEDSAKEGIAMFSIRTNTPVVPMMFNKKIKPFKRGIKLIVGNPIYPDPSRIKDKAYLAEYSNLIVEKMNELLKGD